MESLYQAQLVSMFILFCYSRTRKQVCSHDPLRHTYVHTPCMRQKGHFSELPRVLDMIQRLLKAEQLTSGWLLLDYFDGICNISTVSNHALSPLSNHYTVVAGVLKSEATALLLSCSKTCLCSLCVCRTEITPRLKD